MKLIERAIDMYREIESQRAQLGLRPDRLPCEKEGPFCSQRFQEIHQNEAVVPAIIDLLGRCPKGRKTAVMALATSTGVVVLASVRPGGYRPYPGRDLSTPCDKAFGCGV